jgi:hypothetical protein
MFYVTYHDGSAWRMNPFTSYHDARCYASKLNAYGYHARLDNYATGVTEYHLA